MLQGFRDIHILRRTPPKDNRKPFTAITNAIPNVVQPGDPRLKGRTYEQLAAAWWKWTLEMPLTNASGATHNWYQSPTFDITASQSSNLWFIGSPFLATNSAPPTVRHCQIPYGKELFIVLLSAESSNIEPPPFYGATASDQAAIANYWTDHIVDLFCEIDGVSLTNLEAFRFQSPQININAPSPWMEGEVGGRGTSTGDGYFVLLSPFSPGPHTLRMGGKFRFRKPQDPMELTEEINVTYHITVTEPAEKPIEHTASK